MAEDDGPTRPGLPFDPADTQDGPTLQVYVPPRPLPRLPKPPPIRRSQNPLLAPPAIDTATLPRFAAAELDETATLKRNRSPSQPYDPSDADETLTLRRSSPPSLDEVATTELAPVPKAPPSADQTRPFVLIQSPNATAPFPLVRRDQTESLREEPLLALPVLPAPVPLPEPPPASHDPRAVLVFAASVLATLAVALVIVVGVVAGRRAAQKPLAAPPSSAVAPTGVAGGCAIRVASRAIASSIQPTTPPIVAPALSDGELAIGFAQASDKAAGVVLKLADLSIEPRFSQRASSAVSRVTPVERDGSLKFLVDHDDAKLTMARTVPEDPPFRVGSTYFGVARATSGTPETVWPGGKGAAQSEPAFARVDGVGWFTALSRGRIGGSVHAGWLTARGLAKTELGELALDAYEVGAPSVAAGSTAVAVAVAIRDAREAPARVVVASTAPGSVPKTVVPLSTGPGPERSHPSITALAGGGWLVSWIEGGDHRSLRAQRLDAELRGVAPPFDVASGLAIERSPGALHRADERILALHVARGARGAELWATVLECE